MCQVVVLYINIIKFMITKERAREIRNAVQKIDRITQRRIDIVMGEMIAFRAGSVLAGFVLFVDLVIEASHKNFHTAGIVILALGFLWIVYHGVGHFYMRKIQNIRKEYQDQIEVYVKELQGEDTDDS